MQNIDQLTARLAATDRADVKRAAAALHDFEDFCKGPQRDDVWAYPQWAGRLQANVDHLLDVIEHVTRPPVPQILDHDEGTSYCTSIPGGCTTHPDPRPVATTGTGWPA